MTPAAKEPKRRGLVLSRPNPEGVLRQTSGDQAASYIRRLIFDGELQPGMRLPQDQIAEALGVSRIPIREAIVALEREGWLTTHLNRGAFVNTFDSDTIRDHYELFGLIYGLAARRAVERNDPQLADRLAPIARKIGTTDDPFEVQELAIAFHSTIVKAANSPSIPVMLRAMSALVPGPFYVLVPEAIEPEQRGLAAIARAVKRGDANRAASEYSKMLKLQTELVVALYHQRNLIARSNTA
ncbi:MAG: GntR family transcriptional regulator [Acidimicrobiales bacterium]